MLLSCCQILTEARYPGLLHSWTVGTGPQQVSGSEAPPLKKFLLTPKLSDDMAR